MSKFYYVRDYKRIVNSGCEGQRFRNYMRVGFFYRTSTQINSKRQNVTLIQKRGNIYSNQLTYLETIILWFLGKFCNFMQGCHNWAPSTWISTYQHNPTKNSNGRCLGHVAFECHTKFHINWESFAHRNQQKLVQDMMPLNHASDKCQVLVRVLLPL